MTYYSMFCVAITAYNVRWPEILATLNPLSFDGENLALGSIYEHLGAVIAHRQPNSSTLLVD